MPIPLRWWAEKPYSSTKTRFWVEIPYNLLQQFGNNLQIKLYYNNPNAQNYYPPDVVFSNASPALQGFWDFTASGFNVSAKILYNQVGNYWDAQVNYLRSSFQESEGYRPVFLGKHYWDGSGEILCRPLALIDGEYINFTFTTPPLTGDFVLVVFLDFFRFKNIQPGQYAQVSGTLLQFRSDDNATMLQLRYEGVIECPPALSGTTGYANIRFTALAKGGTVAQTQALVITTPTQVPVIGNLTPLVVYYNSVQRRYTITLHGTATIYINCYGDNLNNTYLTIGALYYDGVYTDFGAPCVGGIAIFPIASASDANIWSTNLTLYSFSPEVISFFYGCRYYVPNIPSEPSRLLCLPPRNGIQLTTNNANLRYGSTDTSIPGYNRSILVHLRNPNGIDLRRYETYGKIVLPIELNTQEAISQGLLRADLGDILFVCVESTYTPPAPPPPPPPPPTEEPPAPPAMPPQGTCAYSFADADSENPVFGLTYDGMARILRDAGIAFPVPYNSDTQTIELYPVPAYGVTFVRWLLSYKDSQSGEAKTATGVGLPISVRGLNIDWGVGVTVKFFVKGIKGVARQPSSDKSKFGAHSASGYLQLPTIQPTWRSGDYTIRYGVGYDVYKIAGDMKIRYSVGIDYTPVSGYLYQNVRTGEEDWELVFASPTSHGAHPVKEHLQGYRLRHFHASGNMMYLLAVSETPPVKVKLITINLSNGNVTSSSAVTLGAEGDDEEKRYYPSFGAVAVGHGGIVYANTHGAVYFPFSGAHEPLLLTFLSSSFPIEKKMWSSVGILVVPEGFLFLPYAILWDMDTYYDYSTNIEVSEGDRLIPVYFNGVAGVVVRSREYSDSGGSSTLKAFYIWGGFNKGLVRAQVGAAEGLEKVPPYLSGALVNNRWYAFNAAAHPDEATIAEYELNAQGDMENWKFVTSALLKVLPLPFSAPALRAKWKPPAWGELWGFNITANAAYIYFSRVWDRIYRLDVGSKEIRLAHSIPYLDFGGNIIPRFMGGEEAWLMFSYNLEHGRVYCAHLRVGERLQIWRQTNPVTPPPAPTVTFPPPDIQVPRQFDVQFKPHAYTYPQEFSVTIVAETANGASVWHYYSTLHRNLFEVSFDNGVNFAPMLGPVTVTESNDGSVIVKFNIPYPLPASATVTVTVRAIGIVQ